MTARDDKHVILLDIDGLRDDVLTQALTEGLVPNIAELAARGMRAGKAVTVFPAMTYPAQTSILTGSWPRRHGVVSNSWLDRERLEYQDYCKDLKVVTDVFARDMFGLPTLILPRNKGAGALNKKVRPGSPSIYSAVGRVGLSTAAVFHQFNIGVDQWQTPTTREMIVYALISKDVVKKSERYDQFMVKRALKVLAADPPNLMLCYFANLDSLSHKSGISAQKEYLSSVVDPMIGRLMESMKGRGLWDKTYWFVFSDHGQVDVDKDEAHWVSADRLCEVLEHALPERGEAFHVKKQPLTAGHFAVVAIEGVFCQLYVRRTDSDWSAPPRLEEDVLPALEALLNASGTPIEQGGLGNAISLILIKNPSGEYEVYAPGPSPGAAGRMVGLEDFFADREAEYPDAVERIRGFQNELTADVVLLSNHAGGYYMDDHMCAGHHGGLSAAESNIPLLISGPDIETDPGAAPGFVRSIDLAPTAARLLGVDMPGVDGRVIDVLKK